MSCFVRFLLSVRSLHRECYVLFRSHPVVCSAHYTGNVMSCFVRILLSVPLITPGMLCPASFASCCLFRSLHRECYVLFRSLPAVCSAHYTGNVMSCFVRILLSVPLITPGMYVLFRSHPVVCSAHYTGNVISCFVRFLLSVPLITP